MSFPQDRPPYEVNPPPPAPRQSRALLITAIVGGLVTLCLALLVCGVGLMMVMRSGPDAEAEATATREAIGQRATPSGGDADSDGGAGGRATPGAAGSPTAIPTRTPVVGVSRPIQQLGVGDCFIDPDFAATEASGIVESVEVVDCLALHDSEVYATSAVSAEGDAPPFPGEEALSEQGNRDCLAAFEEYVGVPYERSFLAYLTLLPTEQSWATGDRLILCVLYDGTGLGQLRDSMRDIRQ